VTDLRLVLFDFGGTLDAPGVPWVDRFVVAYRKAGLHVTTAALREAAGAGTRAAYRTAAVAGYDLRETVAFHVARQLEHLGLRDAAAAERVVTTFVLEATTALAESRALLERLRRRFRLGIVSNFYGNLQRILDAAGLAPLLSTVIDSTAVGLAKPDPGVFTLALAAAGASPSETLYVGDSMRQDILPARAAGLRTAWLVGPHGDVACDADDPADLRLGTLGDVERLLCMKAGIIAAGHGERLRRGGIPGPKPLVHVAGRPLIDHALHVVRTAGLRQVACIVNEESGAVETHCRETARGLSLAFVRRTTPSPMESLFALEPYLRDDTFLLLTVDGVIAPIAVREFVTAASRRADADVVLAVSSFIDDEKPLHVACAADGRITALGAAAAASPLVTAGFYVLRPTIFAEVTAARRAGFTALRSFLAHLLARGYRTYAERVAKCVDVDRPEDVATAEAFVQSGYRA
jgi:HAD superfamily hydrolase (TIGR01549 family)